jgi:uncharacterized protein (TIGR02444 family)
MSTVPLDGPHWSFALDTYARPGVSDACLLLQDRAGVDVNVLLLVLYAATRRGIALSRSELQDMDNAVALWRQEVIHPLRGTRRRLKTGPGPAPNEVTEALRGRIKQAELQAEQIEQAALAQWLEVHARAANGAVVIADALRDVVAYFAERMSAGPQLDADPAIRDAIATIARQAGDGAS